MSTERKVVRTKDVMTDRYAMVDGLVTVREAMDLYRQENVDVLIVNKRDQDDEYGILLLSDIAKQVVAKDRAPERVNVYEVMAKPVVAVEPRMDVRYCARLFENFGLSVAPVIANGEVQGIVGYTEIVMKGMLAD
ncbi:CBS domain-containing protein [Marinobacterium jannaschii]|uniref:CBS domain-containing protein n=1 Tax=Marinobacterium jannaschii TaxID=64970 RepID=UPI000481D980|nr:CBS domain-containing protein [Marinobacterium jannaschii]